jgi:hypothetical protein
MQNQESREGQKDEQVNRSAITLCTPLFPVVKDFDCTSAF